MSLVCELIRRSLGNVYKCMLSLLLVLSSSSFALLGASAAVQ